MTKRIITVLCILGSLVLLETNAFAFQVTVNWNSYSFPVGVTGGTFLVQRSIDAQVTWQQIGTSAQGTTSFVDPSAQTGFPCYRVIAHATNFLDSDPSTSACALKLGTPQNVTLTIQ